MIYGLGFFLLAALFWWGARVIRGLKRLRKQALGAWEQLAAQLLARHEATAAWLAQLRDNDPSDRYAVQLAEVRQALHGGPLENDIRLLSQSEGDLNAALQAAAAQSGLLPPEARARLAACNNRIRLAAEFYNTQALIYNTRLATMSLKLPARFGGFRPLEAFSFG